MSNNIDITLTEFQVDYLTALLRERLRERKGRKWLTTDDYMIEGLIAYFDLKVDERYEVNDEDHTLVPIH